jgi:hypothetical protein
MCFWNNLCHMWPNYYDYFIHKYVLFTNFPWWSIVLDPFCLLVITIDVGVFKPFVQVTQFSVFTLYLCNVSLRNLEKKILKNKNTRISKIIIIFLFYFRKVSKTVSYMYLTQLLIWHDCFIHKYALFLRVFQSPRWSPIFRLKTSKTHSLRKGLKLSWVFYWLFSGISAILWREHFINKFPQLKDP